MSVYIEINTCHRCPHADHSGAFTPGGAKPVCNHDAVLRRVQESGVPDYYHWRHRIRPNGGRVPRWCPLGRPTSRQVVRLERRLVEQRGTSPDFEYRLVVEPNSIVVHAIRDTSVVLLSFALTLGSRDRGRVRP